MRGLIIIAVVLLVGAAGLSGAEAFVHGGALYEGRGHMHRVLAQLDLPFIEAHWTITGWKLLGLVGALCFAGRWLVQAWHRQRHGTSVMPTAFWIISLCGAGMVTAYFIWGKNDSVGIVTNALPASVALWNLVKDVKGRRAVAKG
jgi:lipid-A-disaccharide synthase-like uncharacterized protein